MVLRVGVLRPPKPDYFVTLANGVRTGVDRLDLTARDVLQTRGIFTSALTYSRMYFRSIIAVSIGDVFTDDANNEWTIQGVARYGRAWNEVLAQTLSLTPVDPPVTAMPDYRFGAQVTAAFAALFVGDWRLDDSPNFVTGNTAIDLARVDSDDVDVVNPSVGDSITFTWGDYTLTVDITDLDTWSGGFGGSVTGPSWVFNETVDAAQATGELVITT